MARTPNIINSQRSHLASLYVVIVVLACISFYAMAGWKSAPKDIRIHIPPDLRSGAVVRIDEIQAANIYAFANSTMRAVYRWEESGEVDFGKRIRELEYRFTQEYKEQLLSELNSKQVRGELRHRARYVLERPGFEVYRDEYVVAYPDDSWLVWLDLEIVERTANVEAKRTTVRYPFRVVRVNISPEKNAWGLAIDGYQDGKRPRTLSEEELEGEIVL